MLSEEAVNLLPTVSGQNNLYVDGALQKVFERSLTLASKNGDKYVSIDWLLVALTSGNHKAFEILRTFGVTEKAVVQALKMFRKSSSSNSPNAENTFDAVERFTYELT